MASKENTAELSSTFFVVPYHREYLVIVPVFNVKDGWSAAKIADKKIGSHHTKLITCVPYKNDYICVFSSDVELRTKFPVYRVSSESKKETT